MRLQKLLRSFVIFATVAFAASSFAQSPSQYRDKAPQKLASRPDLRAEYGGYIGERVDNVVRNWETRALKANPAMLSVFQLRERQPKSSQYYVPWVGEFIGKYLTNAILLEQASNDPELRATVDAAIYSLMASQDRDGYLGPYSHDERLVVNWDLWGHYHAATALMLYYERTGNADALEKARRVGLFFEKVFYRPDENGTEKGVKDVGSDEVNFSIMTALCQLHRLTGEERFLTAARRVLHDLEERGDFYREGLAGTEFYRTPQPRWESLHTILGLAELYRIEGDESYRRAFLNLWESVYKRDVHNNGSFSRGEQATGTPFKEGAIETCCTVAWTALTVEALRMTGDVRCADALENTLYNAVCAYTHPSGSWCAYDTPMNGRREASFDTIVFQSRPGQPELNCCSVNSPRGFAELVNWGVMFGDDGSIVVNYYGAGKTTFTLGNQKVALVQKTGYPTDGRVELSLTSQDGSEVDATLKLRVPEWADGAMLTTPENADGQLLTAGSYVAVQRRWKTTDSIVLELPMKLRYTSGDGDFAGRISVYYGPLLLAYDQFFNRAETDAIPTIEPKALESAEIEILAPNPNSELVGFYSPQVFIKVDSTGPDAAPIFLTDFAHAGSLGSSYASWLPAKEIAPPVPACERPLQDAKVAPGAIPFTWRKIVNFETFQFRVLVSDDPDFNSTLFEVESTNGKDAVALPEQTKILEPNKTYYWKIVAQNEFGTTESLAPGRRFSVDATLPAFDYDAYLAERSVNASFQTIVDDPLAGEPTPVVGTVRLARNLAAREDKGVAFNGTDSLLVYELAAFPAVEFEATLEFLVESAPQQGRIAQIVSAWTKGLDDPLRVAVDSSGRIYGAVEGTRGGRTAPEKLALGVWHTLRVTKEGRDWTLFVDDEELGRLATEKVMSTDSLAVGLGGNPVYTGDPEFLRGGIANFKLRGICE